MHSRGLSIGRSVYIKKGICIRDAVVQYLCLRMPTPGISGRKIRTPDELTVRTILFESRTPTDLCAVSAGSLCVSPPVLKNEYGVM